jgi:Flp pilus assembly protein TadB
MKNLLRFLLILLFLGTANYSARAQEAEGSGGNSAGISKKQFDKQEAKKSRKDKKEVKREEKRLFKVHRKHQDKATRKRMRRNERGAGKQGQAGQRPGFFRKLFTKH